MRIKLNTLNQIHAFGMEMNGRKWQGTVNNFRFSYNGKEDDKASGWQTQDYGFRTYDYRLGRFYSRDLLFRKFPELSPYQFASNSPIQAIDLDGKEKYIVIYNYNSHDEINQIAINRIVNKDGKAMDNKFHQTNTIIEKTDVLEVHFKSTGIEYHSTENLTDNQQIILHKYNVSSSSNTQGEIRLDGKSLGLNNGEKFDKSLNTYQRSELELNQTINVEFKGGTDKFTSGQEKKLDPAGKILKDFPNSTAEIVGNGGTEPGNPTGGPLGSGKSAMDSPTQFNENPNSTTGELLKGRAERVKSSLKKTFGIDNARMKTRAGELKGDPSGRNVKVKIKGVE